MTKCPSRTCSSCPFEGQDCVYCRTCEHPTRRQEREKLELYQLSDLVSVHFNDFTIYHLHSSLVEPSVNELITIQQEEKEARNDPFWD